MWPIRKKLSPGKHGQLGYFDLTDWWLSTFTESEREYIEATYRPIGDPNPRPLTEGDIINSSQTASGLLHGIATWFTRSSDRYIARRPLAKAEAMSGSNVFDRHFTYQGMIQTSYPDRDTDPRALANAIRACEKQISLAPKAAKAFRTQYRDRPLPHHVGYTQLSIAREKERAYSEAIRLSRDAKEQGWAGDWDKRIARCDAKLRKQ